MLDLGSFAQDVAQGTGDRVDVQVGQRSELLGGDGNRSRRPSDESVRALFVREPKGGLDPAGQRVCGEVGEGPDALRHVVQHGLVELGCGGGCFGGRSDKGLAYDPVWGDLGPEEAGGHACHLDVAFFLGGPGGHGRAGPHHLELVAVALVTQPADQHGYVGALSATVGVQLVESEELEPLSSADEVLALVGPGQDQLEHDVVRKQDVRGLSQDPHTLVAGLLAGVAGVGDGLPAAGVTEGQELLELADLRVGEGVHGVDDDRLDSRASLPSPGVAIAKNGIHNGHDVGQRLAGAGASREDVALARPGYLDRLMLMLMQHDWVSTSVLRVLLAAKDARRLRVQ